jgi:integrase
MNSRSRHAIDTLKPLSFLNGEFLFYHDNGDLIRTAKVFRTRFKFILKKLGIRERRMYDMRHTFATFGLMSGVNPAYLAKQLGHSIEEFFKTYSRWINSTMDDLQIQLIEAAIFNDRIKLDLNVPLKINN